MTILVATDFSDPSIGAINFAADFARRRAESLTVLHVMDYLHRDDTWRILYETPHDIEATVRDQSLADAKLFYQEHVPAQLRPEQVAFAAAFGDPVDTIVQRARALNATFVVAGIRGESRLKELLLGSTARTLARVCNRPVILVPSQQRDAHLRTIIAPVDFSQCSRVSLRHAMDLARQHHASVSILHAFVLPQLAALPTDVSDVAAQLESIKNEKAKKINAFYADIDRSGVDVSVHIVQKPPHLAIADFAREQQANLICMGTHGRRGFARLLLGNTAERVLRHAPCPVLTVRTTSEQDPPESADDA